MDRHRLQSTSLGSHPFLNTAPLSLSTWTHSIPLLSGCALVPTFSVLAFDGVMGDAAGWPGCLHLQTTIPRTPGKVVPTNRWSLLWAGVIGGSVAAKGGSFRACESLHVFARVWGWPYFFSSVRACFWDMCGWGVYERENRGAWQLKMFKICWPDRALQDRLVNGVFWKVFSCSFNEPWAKRLNEACSVCQNSPSAWPLLTCATPTPLEGRSPWWPAERVYWVKHPEMDKRTASSSRRERNKRPLTHMPVCVYR